MEEQKISYRGKGGQLVRIAWRDADATIIFHTGDNISNKVMSVGEAEDFMVQNGLRAVGSP